MRAAFILTLTLTLSKAEEEAVHYCAPLEEACDYQTHYFNWLACGCFAQYWCEIGCWDPGYVIDPRETCGSCMSPDEIAALYPPGSTDAQIKEASSYGSEMARNRPDDMRVCKEEDQQVSCQDDEYFDELACKCLSAGPFCEKMCMPGLVMDPESFCGDCITQEELHRRHYPKWADPNDVAESRQAGLEKYMQAPRWRVCPYEENIWECENGEYWNELACQCFKMASCRIGCPEGTELSPLAMCECTDSAQLRSDLYPEWASDEQIAIARNEGFSHVQERNWDRHECGDDAPVCSEDFYFNELACKCFSLAQCFAPCPLFDNPQEPCGCYDTEEEFLALFPEWASGEDIRRSYEARGHSESKEDDADGEDQDLSISSNDGQSKDDGADSSSNSYVSQHTDTVTDIFEQERGRKSLLGILSLMLLSSSLLYLQ